MSQEMEELLKRAENMLAIRPLVPVLRELLAEQLKLKKAIKKLKRALENAHVED